MLNMNFTLPEYISILESALVIEAEENNIRGMNKIYHEITITTNKFLGLTNEYQQDSLQDRIFNWKSLCSINKKK